MTIRFLETILQTAEKPEAAKVYKCENCYRPNLKAEQVSIVSRGEAYCNACVKGASNEYRGFDVRG